MSRPEDDLRKQLRDAEVENARLRGELEALRQSLSWRLTKPLRRVKQLFARRRR